MDDGSSDESLAIVAALARTDSRFHSHVRTGQKKGANVCRNLGLACCSSEYVIFLDSDDLLAPNCLANRVAAMDQAPRHGYGVFRTEVFASTPGDRGVLWNQDTEVPDLYRFLSIDPTWHTSGPIWRREHLQKLFGFDEELLSFHDWDLHVRALIARIPYFKSSARDHFYRMGDSHQDALRTISCSSPAHLQSHERLFRKTVLQLRSAELMSPDIELRLGGMYWWLAMRWLRGSQRNPPQAGRVWKLAFKSGLVPRRPYIEGAVLLRFLHVRGVGRLATVLQRKWPEALYRSGSPHLHA